MLCVLRGEGVGESAICVDGRMEPGDWGRAGQVGGLGLQVVGRYLLPESRSSRWPLPGHDLEPKYFFLRKLSKTSGFAPCPLTAVPACCFAADLITQPHDTHNPFEVCFDSNFPSLNSLSFVKERSGDGVKPCDSEGLAVGERCGVCVHVCTCVLHVCVHASCPLPTFQTVLETG